MTPASLLHTRSPALTARIAAVSSLGAGLIHAAVAREHFAEWWAYGLFFVVVASFQVGWAVVVWHKATRSRLLVGLLVNAATIALWIVTRSRGLPFGPDRGAREAIGVADAACALLEIGVAAFSMLALRSMSRQQSSSRLKAIAGLGAASLVTLLLVGVAVASPEAHGAHAVAPEAHKKHVAVESCDTSAAHAAHGNTESMTDGERHELAELPAVSCATAADTQAAADLLHHTIAATAQYRDIQVATAAGFDVDAAFQRFALEHPLARLRRIQLVHVPNRAYRNDDKVADPNAPETLIYRRDKNGNTELVGVMYTAPDRQPGPDLAGPYTRWHYHDVCRAPDKSTSPKLGTGCPSGTQEASTGYMMHVWFVQDSDLPYAYALGAPTPQLKSYQQQVSTH